MVAMPLFMAMAEAHFASNVDGEAKFQTRWCISVLALNGIEILDTLLALCVILAAFSWILMKQCFANDFHRGEQVRLFSLLAGMAGNVLRIESELLSKVGRATAEKINPSSCSQMSIENPVFIYISRCRFSFHYL